MLFIYKQQQNEKLFSFLFLNNKCLELKQAE